MNARGIDVSKYTWWLTRLLLASWKTRHRLCYGQINVAIGTIPDPYAEQHRNNLLAEGYLTGPYQALHEAATMPAQARLLIAKRDPRDKLPNWADVERPGLTEAMVSLWCDVYDNETDVPLWIYTSQTAWNRIIRLNPARYEKYGLVVADYGPGTTTSEPFQWPGRPLIPKPWAFQTRPYEIWQYAGDNGRLEGAGQRAIDLSEYQGTEAELRARFELTQEPVPGDQTVQTILAHVAAIRRLVETS